MMSRKLLPFYAFANRVMARDLFDDSRGYFVETLALKKKDREFRVNLLGLNSCLFAGYDGDDRQNLALGIHQVDGALKQRDEDALFSIGFFHHPFSCFHPADKVSETSLMRGLDLILMGHLHEPSNAVIRNTAGRAILIRSGASYETRESKNSFNVTEIDLISGDGSTRYYKYLPDHDRWKPDTDVNPDDPDGAFSFVIDAVARRASQGSAGAKPSKPRPLSDTDLENMSRTYLSHLLARHRYLDFRGMGVLDRAPLRLPLVVMYVPLKARIDMPDGETWIRELKLAGRPVAPKAADETGLRLGEPSPVLDLLKKNDGLIILGDPGAGKTTFLKYLALMTAMGKDASLGIDRRLPLLIPLSAYANALAEQEISLDRFIVEYFRNQGIDLSMGAIVEKALAKGACLLLLDGLDEVQSLAQRHLVVDRVIDYFLFHRRQGNRFVLTSRIVGYRDARPVAEGLVECTLMDFEEKEIKAFVKRWTRAMERAAGDNVDLAERAAAREEEELLASIKQSGGVRRLAANPLLLTILALMKRQGVILPERRVELYQKYMETLLRRWNLARGLDKRFRRDLDVVETIRILAPLALWMHEKSPGKGLVKKAELQRELQNIYENRREEDPEKAAEQFLADVRGHTALLLERGPGLYGFIHLTFQEYLAAVAVASKGQRKIEPVVQILADHIDDPAWSEVFRLTVSYIGLIQQREEAADVILTSLLDLAPGEPGQAVVMSGEAVLDAWPGGVTRTTKDKVVDLLLKNMRGKDKAPTLPRAEAGSLVARLGDPRPEVMTTAGMEFCLVPAGPFHMGSDEKSDPDSKKNETPQHTVDLSTFYISHYPVTIAQFDAFIKANGYNKKRYWLEAEKAGVWCEGKVTGASDKEPRKDPLSYGPATTSNLPIFGMTWFEAFAFTRWLEENWLKEGLIPGGWTVHLPLEAEWEKTSRGGNTIPTKPVLLPAKDVAKRHGEPVEEMSNPLPHRKYPWGDKPSTEFVMYNKNRFFILRSVGCFKNGASPYRCEEMSGTIMELTRSRYKKYPYIPNNGREILTSIDLSASMVLRGESFPSLFGETEPRCSHRSHSTPKDTAIAGFRVVLIPPDSGS